MTKKPPEKLVEIQLVELIDLDTMDSDYPRAGSWRSERCQACKQPAHYILCAIVPDRVLSSLPGTIQWTGSYERFNDLERDYGTNFQFPVCQDCSQKKMPWGCKHKEARP